MNKLKVIVAGAGFAGMSAVKKLCSSGIAMEVWLIDRKQSSDFLPLLPDIISHKIMPDFLSYSIKEFAEKNRVGFINSEIKSVDLEKKTVCTDKEKLVYDYLIIAGGSETNFYGNEQIKENAYKLDNVKDAERILKRVTDGKKETFVISGGGYTGIEIATGLRRYLNKIQQDNRIIIVERSTILLEKLPEKIRNYTLSNLNRLNIDIFLDTVIDKTETDKITLSNGLVLEKAMLIWASGVKTTDFIYNLEIVKDKQGRIKVDEYLRVNDFCFAAGDAASFCIKDKCLRMSVQFSITQGRHAAANIIKHIRKEPLKKYRPVDLGYIIPMSNNRSCGRVLSFYLYGLIATFLHYFMCLYRCPGFKNKMGIITGLIRRTDLTG